MTALAPAPDVAAPERERRRGYLADDDLGLDFLRDVGDERNRCNGFFSRCGDVFIARTGSGTRARHAIWVAVPDRWVDASDLFGRYVGPLTLPAQGVARWFPGTTAAGHRYNARARWYAEVDAADARGIVRFEDAKAAGARWVRHVRTTV